MANHLTPPERETVILLSDADGTARISTHQRTILTKLRHNPAAREVQDLTCGSTAGAAFEIDADLISFRSKRRTASPDQVERIRAARS